MAGLRCASSGSRQPLRAKVVGFVLMVLLGTLAGGGGALAVDPLAGLLVRPNNPTCVAGDRPTQANGVRLAPVFAQVTSFKPFYVQQSPSNPVKWYFSTRDGKVYSFNAPNGTPQLVLNVADLVGALNQGNAYNDPTPTTPGGSEHWGISSFALHPNFAANGQIFLQINGRKAGELRVTSMVMRYTLVSTPAGFGTTFDRSTEKLIISQVQTNPGVLHHWGHVAFGPDGFFYIGSGDGTNNNPANRAIIPAQNCTDLRGKVLRINVNTPPAGTYTIPADNPYAASATCRREIFAVGVRNPWRFSFDPSAPLSSQLWLGDVGKSTWEEANLIVKGGNYGWPIYEGPDCSGTPAQCARTDLIAPVDKTNHAGQPAAAIGGFVYRGTAMPWLVGDYIYSIFPRAELIALHKQPSGTYQRRTLLSGATTFSSYFTDNVGEIYGISGHSAAPVIQKLVKDASVAGPSEIPATLTQTGCFTASTPTGPAKITAGAIPYEVISPLWSDAAAKKRWVALPNGARITIKPDGDFDFPIGTVLIKEFAFQGKPFETRLLMRHNDGVWQGYTYAWRDNLSNADLVAEGGLVRTIGNTPTSTIEWAYPSRSQCFQCHTTAAGVVLGPETRQLNNIISTQYPATKRWGNQLATWAAIGLFDKPLTKPVAQLPSMVNPALAKFGPILRARSFLDTNCAGCHRPDGPTGKAIDLRFSTPINATKLCNGVQTAGDVTYPGATILTPQKPSKSALSLRIHALGLGQMPPLGRELVDTANAALIDAWINRADVCGNGDVNGNGNPDDDGDGIPDNADNCRNVSNPMQTDTDGDRYGNRCDGDWNNNLVADNSDLADLMGREGALFRIDPRWVDKYDLNGDGAINAVDIDIFTSQLLNKAPGPSGLKP